MSKKPTRHAKKPIWDVFISHASEDKEDVARPLAAFLTQAGLRVWLDEAELMIGDSLRRKIDAGLMSCRYGVTILSKAFFAKEWPQKELDALVAREINGSKVILPVWHNLGRAEIAKYSPLLADRLGISTDSGLLAVADAVFRAARAVQPIVHGQGPEPADTSESPSQIGRVQLGQHEPTGPRSVDLLLAELLARVANQYNQEVEITGIRTGFYDFDRLTGGLQPGELYVLGARPSMGSTTFSLCVSEHVATSEGLPVLFFSLQTKNADLVSQLIAATGRISRIGLATGRLEEQEWGRLTESVAMVAKSSLYFDDLPQMTINHIVESTRTRHREIWG